MKEDPTKDPEEEFKNHQQRKERSRLLCAEKDSCFGDVVPSCDQSIEVLVC